MRTLTKKMFEEIVLCTKASNPASNKVLVTDDLIRYFLQNYDGGVVHTTATEKKHATYCIEVKVGKVIFVGPEHQEI